MSRTIVDFYIDAIIKVSEELLGIKMPGVVIDILNTQPKGAISRYYPEENSILINYTFYADALNEMAEVILKDKNALNTKECFFTTSTIALGMLLFHEARHCYQHFHPKDEWVRDFFRDSQSKMEENPTVEAVTEYANLSTEIDARAFSVVALAIFYENRSFLNFVDDPSGNMDRTKYNKVLNELIEEFSDRLI